METKFKVGDKVRVKSQEWYNQNKDGNGYVYIGQVFTPSMIEQCGSILTIKEIYENYYLVKENTRTWQDWMFEEKPVTEEKPEVEQLNKNSMETKEMTKEEVLDYLKDKKFICKSKEERSSVFSKLETLGIEVPNMSDFAFMFFIEEKFCLTYTASVTYWIEDNKKSIEVSEILSIEIEKPKFNPKDLKPFDKVLVRQGKHSEWLARFFDFCEDDNYNTTSGSAWVMCIPYNEETKYLHGTAEEEPEFYKIWK